MTLFTCVTLSSVQKVYLDIIQTIFLHVPLIFLSLQREMLSLTRGPGLLVINTIHSSNTVVFPSTTFFAETTASSKIATWKAMRPNDVALNYWTFIDTERSRSYSSLNSNGAVFDFSFFHFSSHEKSFLNPHSQQYMTAWYVIYKSVSAWPCILT